MNARARSMALVALVGALVGGAPLLLGPPGGDDAYYHAMRAQQHARCWLGGVPFPRWYPDLNDGLGGPEPRAYPVVPLALHAALALLVDDGVGATALATLAIPILAGLLMLDAARRRGAGEGAAVVAAVIWTASPYLVLTLHERVALAEGWGLALLPAVLARLLPPEPGARPGLANGAAAFGLLAATQVPLAFMAAVLIAGAHVASRTWGAGSRAAAAIALGLGLAAPSWLPNVESVSSLAGDLLVAGDYAWRAHLLPFTRMTDRVLAGHLDATLAAVALAAAALLAIGRGAARRAGAAALICAALATPIAWWAYRWAPGFAFLQFPWRWLGVASCLVCLGMAAEDRRWPRALAAAVLLAPLVLPMALRWRLPAGAQLRPRDAGTVVARAATRYGVPAILPSLPAYVPRGCDLAVPLSRVGAVRAALPPPLASGPRRWSWRLHGAPRTVVLPLLAAPEWRVTVDGRPTTWRQSAGMVAVDLPAGEHDLSAEQALSDADRLGLALGALALTVLVAAARRPRQASAALPATRGAGPTPRAGGP